MGARIVYPRFILFYGCLTSLVGLYAHWSTLFDPSGSPAWMRNDLLDRIAPAIIAVHGFFVFLSFTRDYRGYYGLKPRLAPVFPPTPRLILVGRGVLAAAFLNLCYSYFLIFNGRVTMAPVTATYLLCAIYIVVHWGLRPENVFGARIMQIARGDS